MEMYKKPVMNIVELEKVDVLTASCYSCGSRTFKGGQHMAEDGCYPLCDEHKDIANLR